MDMGNRIKELRIKAGLTQTELGDKLGIGASAVAKYENGRVKNIKQSTIAEMARIFGCAPSYVMALDDVPPLPPNIITPAARPVPILGTICAGDGTVAEENFVGIFFIDNTVQADYALRVNGDSMVEAEIYNGDMAFLRKDFEFRAGWIYAVVHGVDREASLKKVFRQEDKLILQPCNSDYSPIIADVQDCYIVGELVGVYHSYSGTIVCK